MAYPTTPEERTRLGFSQSLLELTFNCKPLIDDLTAVARREAAYAHVVVVALEDHLAQTRSEYKLPVVYLMDSILKTVGGIYREIFARNLVRTFATVYETVDLPTRAKMIHLRNTWEHMQVFPVALLHQIDARVHAVGIPEARYFTGSAASSAPGAPADAVAKRIAAAQAEQARLHQLQLQTQHHQQQPPYPHQQQKQQPPYSSHGRMDYPPRSQYTVPPRHTSSDSFYQSAPPATAQASVHSSTGVPPPLNDKYREMLIRAQSLPPDQYASIYNHVMSLQQADQLRDSTASAVAARPPPGPPPPSRPASVPTHLHSTARHTPPPTHIATTPAAITTTTPAAVTAVPVTATVAASTVAASSAPNVQDMLSGLMRAFGGSTIPSTTSVVPTATAPPPATTVPPAPSAPSAHTTSAVPAISLTADGVLKERYEGAINALYADQPLQCMQCGIRYPSSESELLRAHMDWHFRMNRRERDSSKHALSRRWYGDEADWIAHVPVKHSMGKDNVVPMSRYFTDDEDDEDDAGGVGSGSGGGDGGGGAGGSAGGVDGTEGSASALLCPVEESDPLSMSCALCHEPLEKFFDEDTELWYFRGAQRTTLPNSDTPTVAHTKCLRNTTRTRAIAAPVAASEALPAAAAATTPTAPEKTTPGKRLADADPSGESEDTKDVKRIKMENEL